MCLHVPGEDDFVLELAEPVRGPWQGGTARPGRDSLGAALAGTGHGSPVDWWSLGIFMHELVYGKSPFRGAKRENTFENIVHTPLRFPDSPTVSPQCQARSRHAASSCGRQRLPAIKLLCCKAPCQPLLAGGLHCARTCGSGSWQCGRVSAPVHLCSGGSRQGGGPKCAALRQTTCHLVAAGRAGG